jgi:uncharacterized cupredoxin-like copper-binding protein
MNRPIRRSAGSTCGRFLFAVILAALPVLTACGSKPELQAKMVEVHLTENAIQMPNTLPSGKTTFEVVNTGTAMHGFSIEGPGGQAVLPSVAPGKTASVQVNLNPGTYRVISPVDAAKGGMAVALNVT